MTLTKPLSLSLSLSLSFSVCVCVCEGVIQVSLSPVVALPSGSKCPTRSPHNDNQWFFSGSSRSCWLLCFFFIGCSFGYHIFRWVRFMVPKPADHSELWHVHGKMPQALFTPNRALGQKKGRPPIQLNVNIVCCVAAAVQSAGDAQRTAAAAAAAQRKAVLEKHNVMSCCGGPPAITLEDTHGRTEQWYSPRRFLALGLFWIHSFDVSFWRTVFAAKQKYQDAPFGLCACVYHH